MDIQAIRQEVVDEKSQAVIKGSSEYLYAAVKREVAEMSDADVLGYAEIVGILDPEDDENGDERNEV